jgi:L-2-hydroxyglutarate oxidase LhgO
METVQVDVLIIGAGVVGCAIASKISEKFEGQSIVIIEAGPRIAEGVTSRNSGVIHAGIYYKPGSLKADLCIRGNQLLYEWALKKNVAHKKMGKLIIARGKQQEVGLHHIFENAKASGAPGLRLVGKNEITELEPEISGDEAIFSSETGIVDPFELSQSLLYDAQNSGATLMTSCKALGIECLSSGDYQITTNQCIINAPVVINSAGLNADEVSNFAGIKKYEIYPCRGDYFNLKSVKKFTRLIYPVKDPSDPGLGVHLTIDLAGQYKLGPDVEYVLRKDDFTSATEKLERFRLAAENLLGPIPSDALSYNSCGIRPKLRSPLEKVEKDFVISQDKPGFINLVGIESPGLTASLAIAEKVCDALS